MNRELTSFDYRRVIDTIRRANAIAANNDLDALLDQMLDLFVEVASAQAGTLYLYDAEADELIFKVVKGDPHSQALVGTRFPSARGIAGAALHAHAPIFIPDVAADPRWDRRIGELSGLKLTIDEDTGQFVNFDLNGTYNITNNFGVQGGYRSVNVEYAIDQDSGNLELNGLYFGGVARF